MTFLLAIFVLVPLAVAVAGTFLVLLLLYHKGISGELVLVLLISMSLTASLAYMAFRILRRPKLELAGGVAAPPFIGSLLVGLVVVQTAAMVALAFAFNLGAFSVRNWVGGICLVLGLLPLCTGSWLLLSTHWRIRSGGKNSLVGTENLEETIALQAKNTRILVPSSLFAVVASVVAYYSFDGARYFSLLDLGGVIFLIVSGVVVRLLDNFRFRMIQSDAQSFHPGSLPS